jgi:hypothetical protein
MMATSILLKATISPGRLNVTCQLVIGLIQAAYVMFPEGVRSGCIPVEIGENAQEARAANPGKPFCGRWIETFTPRMSWKLNGVPVAELTAVLGQSLNVPVIDRTGLTGLFNFALEYEPDETSPAAPIVSAVQNQLGLKLERTKGPRGFLVIDQIERPAPNGPLLVAPQGRAAGAGGGR